jgi:magnesium transporter
VLATDELVLPSVELQHATPNLSEMGDPDLQDVNKKLLNTLAVERNPIARDFENAIDDSDSDAEGDVVPGTGKHSRRFTNREGRNRPPRHDRSRDTSSSRSTSPANSVEAFAEPRRRQRANTAESHASSFLEQIRQRTYSNGTNQRRPTLSNISLPPALTHRTDREVQDDVTFPMEEEPGKTYKIDFEELEEFVVLSAQGKISDDIRVPRADHSRVFGDLRKTETKEGDGTSNVVMNCENFFEAPLCKYDTSTQSSSDEKFALKDQGTPSKPAERFYLFSSELPHGKSATKLGDFVADGTTFRDLFEVGPEGGVWWLDVLNPTKSELEVLAKAFKIHRLTREDIETQEAREKVELFSQYYFVCFRTFNMDSNHEDFLDPIHVYIVVCGDGVLSFSYAANPHAMNVRKRISKLGDFLSLGPDYICYAMIDDIVDCFAPVIREAETESENIEDQVFIAREDDFLALLRQIGDCRKRVLNMMRLLGGKADVIKGFAKRCNDQYQMTPRGDIGLYLGDIQDHVVTMMSNLGHVEKMLSRSHANYLAQLNVDNILKGNSTNKALAKITVVATILVPLNLVTGLFGMNVTIPGQDSGQLYWFFGILGGIALFVVTSLFVARRIRAL